MIDREKVINDLQDAVNDDWMWQHADYYAKAMENAIALLKEQEDQEYVEPIPTPTDSSGWFFKCNKCSNPINWKDKFCSMCGKAVKWE